MENEVSQRPSFVTARDLGRHTAELLDSVMDGKPLVITRRGVPIATIQATENVALLARARRSTATEAFEEPDEPLDLASLNVTDDRLQVLESFSRLRSRAAVMTETGLSVSTVGASMGMLEVRGLIKRTPAGYAVTDLGERAIRAWKGAPGGIRFA